MQRSGLAIHPEMLCRTLLNSVLSIQKLSQGAQAIFSYHREPKLYLAHVIQSQFTPRNLHVI